MSADAIDVAHLRHLAEMELAVPASLHDFETRLVVPVDNLVRHLADGRLVRQFKRVGTVPLHADNGHQCVRQYATHSCVWLEVFKLHRVLSLVSRRCDNCVSRTPGSTWIR